MRLKYLFAGAGIMAATCAHAGYTVECPKGVECGVSSYSITETDIPLPEANVMMASIDIAASTSNISTRAGQSVTVPSYHTVCFSTFLTTEADYSFVLNVGGKQSVMKNHIVIPARKKTCISTQLYQNVMFSSAGNYQFTATSTGNTFSTGLRQASSSAFVFVK